MFLLLTAAFAAFSVKADTFTKLAVFGNLATDDEVVITMAYAGTTYALSAEDATGKPPKSEAVTLTDGALVDPADKYIFKAEQVTDGYRFVRENGDFLYMIDDTKGLRVGKPKAGTTYADVFNVHADVEYKGYMYAEIKDKEQFIGVWHKDGDEASLTYFARYPYSTSGSSGWKKNISNEEFALYVNSPSGDPSEQKYTVTAADVEGGTIAVSFSKAGAGTLIDVLISPDKGFDFVEGSLMLTYNDGVEDIQLSLEGCQFEMPAADVTVTGEFEGRAPRATIDFTDVANLWQLPENRIIETQSFTNEGMTITITGTGNPEKMGGYVWSTRSGGHLLLGRKDAVLQLPTFDDCEVAKIVTNGTDEASGLVEMNVFVGDKAVSTKTVGSKTQNTYLIGSEDRGVGTQYNLVILNDNTAQLSYIDIYATVPGAPEAPEMSVKAGIYKDAQTVALSCLTEGASIYYTTDSSRPTEKLELLYTNPIVIEKDQTKTIRAIAVKDGIKSEISSATYVIADVTADGTLENPYSVADVHKLGNPGWKAWVHGWIINGYDTKTHELSGEATNAIAIADAFDEADKANMSFVELPQGKTRDELNIAAHPENAGKEIWIYGVLSKYGNQPGVSKVTKYYLDELPEPEVPSAIENDKMSKCENVKILLDGQLFIIRNGVWYNATGVRVQ